MRAGKRDGLFSDIMKIFATLCLFVALAAQATEIRLTDSQALEIGKRIWKNGIAHFIWYPQGKRGPFEESWPGLAKFLKTHGAPFQDWMLGPCPWKKRAEFLSDLNGPRLTALRQMLAATIADQARFAAMRLESALPKILAAAPAAQRPRIEANFRRVAAEPLGFYALMDYVNFKGEGVNPAERYNGQGWGLLQVLETMPTSGNALPEFAKAADTVLTRRVKNSPPARNESKWLPGWRNRLATYTR